MSGVPHTHMHRRLLSSTFSWEPCTFLRRLEVCSVSSRQPKVGLGRWQGIPPGAMPLSFHRAAWLSKLFHFSFHSAILAVAGEVSRATLLSRKLRLDGSCFRAAVCPWSRCRVSVPCFLRSAFVLLFCGCQGGQCQRGHKGSAQVWL